MITRPSVRALFSFATSALLLTGCETKKPEETPAPTAAAPAPTPAPAAPEEPHPDCVGPVTAGEAKEIKIGAQTWELAGSTLTLKGELAQLKLGVVTDIKENSPENLANLAAFVKWFQEQKIDALVVAGDSGLDRAQIAGSLQALAGAGVPVLATIGNREGRADFTGAIDDLAKLGNVFNLNKIRRVNTPVADLVSLPGYFNPNYIHASDGCAYGPKQIEELSTIVRSADSPVVLVSHGGPKQNGPEGLDRTAEGDNVGDPLLTALIQKHNIPFGIFGNIHEAGGRATDAAGSKVFPQKEAQPELYLNPGPADGVRWTMNDSSVSLGMAAVMTLKDGKGSYEIFRVKDGQAGLAEAAK